MKILEIITQSAALLGLEDVNSILTDITEENEQEKLQNANLSSLYNLVKFSMQELCTNYIPVVTTKNIKTEDQKFPLSNLENFIRVQKVTKSEDVVKCKIISRNITFEEDGEYVIEYLTYPAINSLFDEIDFLSNLSPDAIIFGLCAYFSLAHGLFEEFKSFHEMYTDKAESLKGLKTFVMPPRRWE